MDTPKNIPKGYRKQDLKVGDASGTVKFTLWEKEIESMKEGESYRISTAVVKEYNGEKYLSTLKNCSCINPIEDIGDVYVKNDSKDDRGKMRYLYSYYLQCYLTLFKQKFKLTYV